MIDESRSTSFEEIEVGQVFETDSYRMSLDRIREFASQYDPQAMHLSEDEATNGPFGELVASGWHTLSVTMRLMVEARPFGKTPLVGAGVDSIRFTSPVYPGDTLFVRAEVAKKKKSRSSGRGFVTLSLETINTDSQEAVVRQQWTLTFG